MPEPRTLALDRGISVTRYPDGQTSVRTDASPGEAVRVVWRLRSNDELVLLLQIANALDGVGARKVELYIPYLLGARSDRRSSGASFDLDVIAACINHCRFRSVVLLDPHSDVAPALIKRSRIITNEQLVRFWRLHHGRAGTVLIHPDAGAAKKGPAVVEAGRPLIADEVHCVKHRNPADGRIELKVMDPGLCDGRDCLIVDDMCDGGATFIAIAEQIARPGAMTLIVTHGIFSKGLVALMSRFDRIITTNSYGEHVRNGVHVLHAEQLTGGQQ